MQFRYECNLPARQALRGGLPPLRTPNRGLAPDPTINVVLVEPLCADASGQPTMIVSGSEPHQDHTLEGSLIWTYHLWG